MAISDGKMRRPWTTAEIASLRENRELGAAALAELLDRSVWSVRHAAYRFGVSLRRPGVACGYRIGKPHGVVLSGELRAAIAKAPELCQDVVDRSRAERSTPICPDCGRRPVEVLTTGLCRSCHIDLLERVYRDCGSDRERLTELMVEILVTHGPWPELPRLQAMARKRRQRVREQSL